MGAQLVVSPPHRTQQLPESLSSALLALTPGQEQGVTTPLAQISEPARATSQGLNIPHIPRTSSATVKQELANTQP